jgi:hypothetical protein
MDRERERQGERERDKERERERERERETSEVVCADSTVHPVVIYFSIFPIILSRPPQKLKRTCSTECTILRQLKCSTK